jgi:methyl-accepting chemotaxis protein
MFNQNSSSPETKIAVLEERLSVYEQMISRIDAAIEKISETNQNISKMLAVHTEKIEQAVKTDNLIVSMIEEVKISSKEQHDLISEELGERIEKLELKVENISKIKWMVVGMGTLTALVVTILSQLAGGIIRHPEKPNQQILQNNLTALNISGKM